MPKNKDCRTLSLNLNHCVAWLTNFGKNHRSSLPLPGCVYGGVSVIWTWPCNYRTHKTWQFPLQDFFALPAAQFFSFFTPIGFLGII